jgi:pSer/pThr/pTyr-binding forkhead associated (FHA) protein
MRSGVVTIFWLQVSLRGQPVSVVPVQDPLVIGRDAEGLVVDDPTVSRRHLVVEPSRDVLVCRDLGSANGTFVDGERISGAVHLRAGARIRLGESELVVHEGRATGSTGSASGFGPIPERPSEGLRDLGRAGRRTYLPRPPQ